MGIFSRTTLISYSTPSHERFQKHLHEAYAGKFAQDIPYNLNWLSKEPFYKQNRDIFAYQKYAGYLLWKPYILLKTLEYSSTDYVLYCDTNLKFTDLPEAERLIEEAITKEGTFIPIYEKDPLYTNDIWTKRDTFIKMDADAPKYWGAPQVWTVILGFGKRDRNIDLLKEYLHYCCDEDILTETPNKLGENLPGFKAHRWEQSVLSILVEKYGIGGTYFLPVYNCIDKIYDTELNALKVEIEKDVLKKDGNVITETS